MKTPGLVLSFVCTFLAFVQDLGAQNFRPPQDASSVDRFVEVVRLVHQQWHDNRRGLTVKFAMDAAKGGNPGYSALMDEQVKAHLAYAVRASGGDGDAAIERFIGRLDPWTSYLAPGDYRRFQSSQRQDYSGVGMDLEKESDGSFTCWPYPGSSADRAGIAPGARLVAVDGRPTADRSLYAIGAMVRGKRGTEVDLSVSRFFGLSSRLNLVRAPAQIRTVFPLPPRNGVQVLQITRFASSTPKELADNIASSTHMMELDLSKCSGGDLDAAVEAASLFLDPGTVIARIHRTGEIETLRASRGQRRSTRLLLHQSDLTASAAEVFIAGLVENHAASSYGGTTKGKATTQDIIPLDKGGALLLTTGLISGPRGQTWHGRGLPPHR